MSIILEKIRVSEIFGPTIQGEGALIGQPTIFLRTGGCDFRCHWCDTIYAIDSSMRQEWILMDSEEIWQKITQLSKNKPLMVTISGGNPAIQPLKPLLEKGLSQGYKFAIETQGSLFKPWFDLFDMLVLSPKPPSSKMCNHWEIFQQCLHAKAKNKIIKIPILDEEDFQFAKMVKKRFEDYPLYLQPVNHSPAPLKGSAPIDMEGIYNRFKWLIARTLEEGWYEVRILPQLHVLIWQNLKGV